MPGAKVRARSETFADHYSQAWQFYLSQTALEQGHIQNTASAHL
jgi:catalase